MKNFLNGLMHTVFHIPCCVGPHIASQIGGHAMIEFSNLMHGPMGWVVTLASPWLGVSISEGHRMLKKTFNNNKHMCSNETCLSHKRRNLLDFFRKNSKSLMIGYGLSLSLFAADKSEILHEHHDHHDHHEHHQRQFDTIRRVETEQAFFECSDTTHHHSIEDFWRVRQIKPD